MIIQNFKLFSKILQLNEVLNAVPCRWNTTLLKLDCVECPKRLLHRRYGLLLHLFAIILYCLQGIYAFGTKSEYPQLSQSELFLYRVGLLVNLNSHITLQTCNKKGDLICTYVNGLIKFQRRHNHLITRNTRRECLNDKLSLLLVYNIVAASLIISLAFPTVLHMFNCCKPSLLGYWLIPECNSNFPNVSAVDILFKFVVMTFNIWMWAFCFVNAGILLGAVLYTMCVVSMRKSIEL